MTFHASGLYLEDPPRDGRPALRCPRPPEELFPEAAATLARTADPSARGARTLALALASEVLRARVPEGEARDGVRAEDPGPWLYVFVARAEKGAPIAVKVGTSRDVAGRLATLQTALPFALECLSTVSRVPPSGERAVHHLLRAAQGLPMRGEWYTRDLLAVLRFLPVERGAARLFVPGLPPVGMPRDAGRRLRRPAP